MIVSAGAAAYSLCHLQAPTKLDFKMDECGEMISVEEQETLRMLRPLRGVSSLAEHLETLLGFTDDPQEKVAMAFDLIHDHQNCVRRETGECILPQWLHNMYA
jgi:hypothetical protein